MVGTHDAQDLETLATFLLALSRADLGKLGIRGAGQIKQRGGDYIAVFDGGNVLSRPTPGGARVFRIMECAAGECEVRTMTSTSKPEFCTNHRKEFFHLDVA